MDANRHPFHTLWRSTDVYTPLVNFSGDDVALLAHLSLGLPIAARTAHFALTRTPGCGSTEHVAFCVKLTGREEFRGEGPVRNMVSLLSGELFNMNLDALVLLVYQLRTRSLS